MRHNRMPSIRNPALQDRRNTGYMAALFLAPTSKRFIMFDFTSARQHMVDSQIRTSDVTDIDVLRAFRAIPRERFVPKSKQALAYSDSHIATDDDRTLISPRDFSKLVMAAEITPSDVVLDVACGRGYSSAILAHLADTVVGLEDTEERVNRATSELTNADINNAAVVQGSLIAGAPEHGPFNVIVINGAVNAVPEALLKQLAHQGRLVTIVKDGAVGRATVYTRSGDAVGERVIFDSNVPLLKEFTRAPEFVL